MDKQINAELSYHIYPDLHYEVETTFWKWSYMLLCNEHLQCVKSIPIFFSNIYMYLIIKYEYKILLMIDERVPVSPSWLIDVWTLKITSFFPELCWLTASKCQPAILHDCIEASSRLVMFFQARFNFKGLWKANRKWTVSPKQPQSSIFAPSENTVQNEH